MADLGFLRMHPYAAIKNIRDIKSREIISDEEPPPPRRSWAIRWHKKTSTEWKVEKWQNGQKRIVAIVRPAPQRCSKKLNYNSVNQSISPAPWIARRRKDAESKAKIFVLLNKVKMVRRGCGRTFLDSISCRWARSVTIIKWHGPVLLTS